MAAKHQNKIMSRDPVWGELPLDTTFSSRVRSACNLIPRVAMLGVTALLIMHFGLFILALVVLGHLVPYAAIIIYRSVRDDFFNDTVITAQNFERKRNYEREKEESERRGT